MTPNQKTSLLTTPGLDILSNALSGSVRLVGGCVRDVLVGRGVMDVDLATTVLPDEVMARLAAAGFKVVPTGIEHGTVTAVWEGLAFEVTTLRRDVSTDGRRATVAFTDDWAVDAARRDFTINALSMDLDGTMHDYFDGQADLAAGRIRFVGEAVQRVREDYLRILRFFRFYAHFGKSPPDAEALAACRQYADQMSTLSAERVGTEMLKLLTAPDPLPALQLMQETGVLAQILTAKDLAGLRALLATEVAVGAAPTALRRLFAISADLPQLTDTLRLSGSQGRWLKALQSLQAQPLADARAVKRAIFQTEAALVQDALLLQGITDRDLWQLACRWEPPVFPLSGQDLLDMGQAAGPKLGQVLDQVQDWWLESDFQPDRQACLQKAQDVLQGSL